ncbi:prevent-host-death protein [Epilithonimonas sp.]|uniref:prevent-host-death protein n=1 Tax=Epilithonimonas sp. TaxID=2894511 RepID=UPI00289961F7|nr:prevent-host-death protein [Epilithonimonas sp.]
MQYTLELDIRNAGSNVVFNNILLNTFKVNIVERYSEDRSARLKLREVLFKVRTLDDKIFKKKDGNLNTYIRGDGFTEYQKFKDVLSSPYYKKKLINQEKAEQNLVHFILSMVVSNYELS